MQDSKRLRKVHGSELKGRCRMLYFYLPQEAQKSLPLKVKN